MKLTVFTLLCGITLAGAQAGAQDRSDAPRAQVLVKNGQAKKEAAKALKAAQAKKEAAKAVYLVGVTGMT